MMSAKAPKNSASRSKNISPSASAPCANTPTPWVSEAHCKDFSARFARLHLDGRDNFGARLNSAVRIQHERGAKQHAGHDERNHAGSEPLGRKRRAEKRIFCFAGSRLRRR